MALGDIKTFDYVYAGLTLKIDAIDNGDGTVKFVVTCVSGSADINALYWSDGDATANEGTLSGFDAKKDASLNMNGTGEAWDGGVKLSSTGIGPQGVDKPTYLQTGETYVLESVALNFDTLDTLGVRATSTSTAGGSIKGVDGDAVPTECPHVKIDDVTVAEEDGNATFTVSIEEAYLYDVVISYTTADGTAGSSDYTTTAGTVTILAGQLTATITVPILDDATPESQEQFVVNLTGATAVLPGNDLNVTDCIVDDQGVGTITDADVVPDPDPVPDPNTPPATAPSALSHGYWKEHGFGDSEGFTAGVAGQSFDDFFGLDAPGEHTWTDKDNSFATDLSFEQAVTFNNGKDTGDEINPDVLGDEALLVREAATAVANLYDTQNQQSFMDWYIHLRTINDNDAVANDFDSDNNGKDDAAGVLADLKAQVDAALSGSPGAYTVGVLGALLEDTHH